MKLTPLIILYPIAIFLFIYHVCSNVWTSFSMMFIVCFILLMTIVIFIERLIIRSLNVKYVRIVELVLMLLLYLMYLFY